MKSKLEHSMQKEQIRSALIRAGGRQCTHGTRYRRSGLLFTAD